MPMNQQTIDNNKPRLIAFYLPQYHPIPENDKWWGKGFTEWTNVTKAKPLFPGHVQPKLPSDLGFYDLRVPEIRNAQAELAQKHGVYGFCYWHYWFGNGRKLLDQPLNDMLKSGKPDFPFCLAWANENWTGIWHGSPDKTLVGQTYPGKSDYLNFFHSILPALSDYRYIRIDDKPLFIIYKPLNHPDLKYFIDIFQNEAIKAGFCGLHIAGFSDSTPYVPSNHNLDSLIFSNFSNLLLSSKNIASPEYYRRKFNQFFHLLNKHPIKVFSYKSAIKRWMEYEDLPFKYYPVIFPNWDNSPRSGNKSIIVTNSTPDLFKQHLTDALKKIEGRSDSDKIIFIKSWNEWAEGNYMEPDALWGTKYLEKIRETIFSKNNS